MSLRRKLSFVSLLAVALMIFAGAFTIRSAIQAQQQFVLVADHLAPEVIALGQIKVAGARIVESALNNALLLSEPGQSSLQFRRQQQDNFKTALSDSDRMFTAFRALVAKDDDGDLAVYRTYGGGRQNASAVGPGAHRPESRRRRQRGFASE